MLSSKITSAEVYGHFQSGRLGYLGNSSACYKMGNYRPNSMKFGTQINADMLSSKITKRKYAAKNCKKLNVKTLSF
jgi:hypothetical protein